MALLSTLFLIAPSLPVTGFLALALVGSALGFSSLFLEEVFFLTNSLVAKIGSSSSTSFPNK